MEQYLFYKYLSQMTCLVMGALIRFTAWCAKRWFRTKPLPSVSDSDSGMHVIRSHSLRSDPGVLETDEPSFDPISVCQLHRC